MKARSTSSLLVMAGHSRSKNGVASARLCPGHPRLCPAESKDVDYRDKRGDDGFYVDASWIAF
jgi:hypothetical protein